MPLIWPLSPEASDEVCARLLRVIGNATGPDRQCHLTTRLIACRALMDERCAKRGLSLLRKAGAITRFKHPNGHTATMLADCDSRV